MVKILTLNVRGLVNNFKRREVFLHIRDHADICCLQETHSSTETDKLWKNEWGGEAFFASYSSQARGTAILIKKNCPILVEKTVVDSGR